MAGKQRNASVELLRVIAMMMIIGHHVVYYSGLLDIEAGINLYFSQMINMGGKLGVNLFVLISAWFLSEGSFKTVRTARIWLQTFTTAAMMLIACVLIWGADSVGNMRHAVYQVIFPVSVSGCWFASTYVLFSLLSPFLNVLVRSVRCKGLDLLLGILTVGLSVIPTVFIWKTNFFTPIFWFLYLYLLAARLKKYPVRWLMRKGTGEALFLLGVGLIFGSTMLFQRFGDQIELMRNNVNYYANRMEVLPMLIASVGLFCAFVRKKPFYSKTVSYLGKMCFGVYLIHDNPIFRGHLWWDIVKAGSWADSPWMIPGVLAVVVLIFAGAAVIESVRSQTIGRLENLLMRALAGPMRKADRFVERELKI